MSESTGKETGQGVMSALASEIGSVVASVQPEPQPIARSTQLCCQKCLKGSSYDPAQQMPAACECGGRLWLGDTPEQAFSRAKLAAGASAPTPKPKAKRVSAPKAAPVEPTPAVEPQASVEVDGRTPKERQQQAQAELIELYELNHTEYKEVGAGVVDAIGYTIWVDSKPNYVMQLPIETALDFRRAYMEDRKTHPAIRFDAAQIQELSEGLRPCVFRGQLIASLVFPGGILRVKTGQAVKIGAKVSGTGTVVWAVLP